MVARGCAGRPQGAALGLLAGNNTALDPVVRTSFSVFKWKDYSASRGRGGGNVKIGFIDFQGLVRRATVLSFSELS